MSDTWTLNDIYKLLNYETVGPTQFVDKKDYDALLSENGLLKNQIEYLEEQLEVYYNADDQAIDKEMNQLRTENERLKAEFHSTRIIPDTPELIQLRTANAELAEALKKHIEKYCPKSLNQSACTWMHDYQDLKQALAKHGAVSDISSERVAKSEK